jgi:hypothetical protein
MDKSVRYSIFACLAAGLAMGSIAFLLMGSARVAGVHHSLLQVMLPIMATATVLIVALSRTARTALGRLCLANGIVSIVLAAASLQGGAQPLWVTDPVYERALDQGMQWWLRHLMWSTAAYSGTVVGLAVLFFILSYWLLHRRHRGAP